ncbi:MAG: zinc dependent phospholipase C family protein [Tissierellia bacterium]|nr:zinc dependent phospholipase C family protein [Tissierellia bacterium]
MFVILPETHRVISEKLYDEIRMYQGVNLNKEKLLWYSVAPDFLPKYKLHRHYREESLRYVILLIIQLIGYGRKHSITTTDNQKSINQFSKQLGVISHFLSDFVTLPHAQRKTYNDSMSEHMQYEKGLNEYVREHEFSSMSKTINLVPQQGKSHLLYSTIKSQLTRIFNEYDNAEQGFETDLNFALDINCQVMNFAMGCIDATLAPVNQYALTPLMSI